MNPLDHPIIFATPRRLARISAWREHIPFGMFMVDLLRPRVLVELGTHWGNSYCAFCQAVDQLHLTTKCYAVDTWSGDAQTGEYGPDVLSDLRAHHDPLYSSFSRLIQSTFDEALTHFNDRTVDLLHLDGLHTYDAVRKDFEAWLPKLSDRGVVLIHDINARRTGFGAWKLWEEVKGRYRHFELLHAHGLGVLAIGETQPRAFLDLIDAPPQTLQSVRDLFFSLGYRLRLQLLLEDTRSKGIQRHEALTRAKEALAQRQQELANRQGQLADREREVVELRGALGDLRNSRLVRYSETLRGVRQKIRDSSRRDGSPLEMERRETAQ